jgi:hypothetical protein
VRKTLFFSRMSDLVHCDCSDPNCKDRCLICKFHIWHVVDVCCHNASDPVCKNDISGCIGHKWVSRMSGMLSETEDAWQIHAYMRGTARPGIGLNTVSSNAFNDDDIPDLECDCTTTDCEHRCRVCARHLANECACSRDKDAWLKGTGISVPSNTLNDDDIPDLECDCTTPDCEHRCRVCARHLANECACSRD